MISIKSFVFNPFQVNAFLLYSKEGECIIVDAACQSDEEIRKVELFIEDNNLRPKALVNTHGHVDHLPGVKYFREKYNIPFYMHERDEFLIDNALVHGKVFGFDIEQPPKPDRYLQESEELHLGENEIRILHVPGHSPGSVVLHLVNEKVILSGDVLFNRSIGRTDLPGGDYNQLISGIQNKLLILDEDITVFPGHGPSTTIKEEKNLNPFLQ